MNLEGLGGPLSLVSSDRFPIFPLAIDRGSSCRDQSADSTSIQIVLWSESKDHSFALVQLVSQLLPLLAREVAVQLGVRRRRIRAWPYSEKAVSQHTLATQQSVQNSTSA